MCAKDCVLFSILLLHAAAHTASLLEQLPVRCVVQSECDGFIRSTLRMTKDELRALSEPEAVNRIVREDIETLSEVDGLTALGCNPLDRMMGPDRKRAIRAKVNRETARRLAMRFVGVRCAFWALNIAVDAAILLLVHRP